MVGTGKEARLTKSSQFANVYDSGKAWVNEVMVLKAVPNGLDKSRFGIVTSKKIGNAVVRNRTRRLFREVVRLVPIEPGWDVVIIARKGAVGARYRDIEAAFIELSTRAKLLGKGDGK